MNREIIVDSTQNILVIIKKEVYSIIKNRDVKNFLSNLGIVFVFRFATAVLSVVIMVLAARYLGVVAMGDIVMIQNIAYLITIPITLGINTSIIKYFPISENGQEKLIGTVFVCNLILCAVWVLIFIIFGKAFSKVVNLSLDKWMLSVILAVSINWSTVLESILRARKQFFRLSSIKVIGSLVYFGIVLFSLISARSFYYIVLGFAVNQGIFCILALKTIKMGKVRFSLETSKFIYRYGAINMVSSGLSTLLFTIDLFIVNHFYSGYEVGIYSVYQVNVKNFFNIMFHDIFAAVFLPTIVQMDKVKIYKRIMSYIPFLLPLAILANAALCMVMLFMYGKNYPFKWIYLLLVSVGTGLHFIYWTFNSVFTVEGKKGAVLCLLVLGIPLPALIAACIFFTKNFGITGTMVSWLVTQVTLIAMFILIIKYKYLNMGEKHIAEQETVI
jgi:O-antigen/teichoic acid export membrane protein